MYLSFSWNLKRNVLIYSLLPARSVDIGENKFGTVILKLVFLISNTLPSTKAMSNCFFCQKIFNETIIKTFAFIIRL